MYPFTLTHFELLLAALIGAIAIVKLMRHYGHHL